MDHDKQIAHGSVCIDESKVQTLENDRVRDLPSRMTGLHEILELT